MGQAAGLIIYGIGAAVAAGSAYAAYDSARESARRQTQLAQQNSAMQMRQYQLQSAMMANQSRAYMAQSSALDRQAGEYLKQADIAATTGKILQANEMARAAQAQKEADEQSRKAAEMRRQLVGGVRTQFAANGVLLESRPQSAVAMWEQDEENDLAYELSNIRERRDNEVWAYVWNGNQARMQGLFDAQALRLQSDATRIEAGTARISAAEASAQSRISRINSFIAGTSWMSVQAQGRANVQSAQWNFYGALGGVGMAAGSFAASKNSSASASPATSSSGGYGQYSLLTGTK